MKTLSLFAATGLISASVVACGKPNESAQVDLNTLINVCKASIHKSIGASTPADQMESSLSGGLVDVAYTRDDGKDFKYQCKYYPITATTGRVVWRGVDIFGDGQGPGVWREREYDPIINYWVTGDSVNKEKITLQQVETGADKKPTGGLSVVKYEF